MAVLSPNVSKSFMTKSGRDISGTSGTMNKETKMKENENEKKTKIKMKQTSVRRGKHNVSEDWQCNRS